MAETAIIGDGPAGLSAALLLAKNGHTAVVFGGDETLMHHAHLYNYLGVPDVDGSEFQRIARQQATDAGARIDEREVTAIRKDSEAFAIDTADGSQRFDHVILAGGRSAATLATELGAAADAGAIRVDGDTATSIDGLYAAGHLVRPERSQAIISAGDGAKAALDILSKEAGRDVHDWDTPGD